MARHLINVLASLSLLVRALAIPGSKEVNGSQINPNPIIVGQQEALDLLRHESSGKPEEGTTTSPTLRGQ